MNYEQTAVSYVTEIRTLEPRALTLLRKLTEGPIPLDGLTGYERDGYDYCYKEPQGEFRLFCQLKCQGWVEMSDDYGFLTAKGITIGKLFEILA